MRGTLTKETDTPHQKIFNLNLTDRRIRFYVRHPTGRDQLALEDSVRIYVTNMDSVLNSQDFQDIMEAMQMVQAVAEECRPAFNALVAGSGRLNVY